MRIIQSLLKQRALLLMCTSLLSALIAVSQEVPTRWTPDVMIKFKRVGGTAISPDGKWVAYTVSTPMMEGERSEFVTQIWVVSTDGKSNTQFTFGEKSSTNPQFSPDGKYLSFLSSRGSDGRNQIWLLRLAGGEAEQATNAKSGVNAYRWSPDAKRIAYVMADPETEKEQKEKKEKRDMVLVDQNYKYGHLYTVSVEKNDKGERTTKRLTGGNFHVTSFHWSPDGKTIVFAHQINPTVDVWPTTDISTVPSDSGAVKTLVAWKGFDGDPSYSPDGKWVAFESDNGDTRWAQARDAYIVSATGGEAKKLAETPDRSFGIIGWSADGKEIYVSETDRTVPRVFALPVSGAKPRIVTTGSGTFSGAAFSRDGGMMSFIHQTPTTPPDVYVSSLKKFEPRKLSDVNPDFVKMAHAKTDVISWKSKDGREIEGLLTYPLNYEKGKRYPLMLNIHGGPAGVFTQNYTGMGTTYALQAFAQEGYAILRPNPRGSSGYGAEFRRANISDWGFGDFDDNDTGINKVIEMGVAHPDSLVICGWSYGGYMTSFTITRTNRFKAASVGAGVTNLMSFVGTADIPSFLPSYFEGEYWDRMDVYMKHSAMFNVKKIQTPTQIVHGERDARVPVSQGWELYVALKRLNVPTEMIIYPRMPHGLQEPKFIADAGNRLIAWFNKYLKRNGGGMVGSK
jgi:dipeptidyl aminopeptidase/acylaminoacyl peptidase